MEPIEKVQYQNGLINNRLTWAIHLSGFLLVAYALAAKTEVRIVFAAIGLMGCLSCLVGTIRANAELDKIEPGNRLGLWFLMPGYAIPGMLMLGWAALIGIK